MPGMGEAKRGTVLGWTTQGICSFSDLSQAFPRTNGRGCASACEALVAGQAIPVAVEEVPVKSGEWTGILAG